jgi:hypothetical protein
MSRRHEWMARADVLVAIGLLAVAQAEIWLGSSADDARPETAVAAALATVALAWRRRAPLVVLTVVMVAFATISVIAELPAATFVLPTSLLAVYSLAADDVTERAVVGLGIALVMLGVSAAETRDATVTGGGRGTRPHRARAARHRRPPGQHGRDPGGSRTHDRRRAGAHPGGWPPSATPGGRRSEGCAGSWVYSRKAPDGAPVAPQPGLGSLDELVTGARGAGLDVALRVNGDLTDLPPSTDLAAFRIVQEALTNALRHARTPTGVRLDRAPAQLTVEICNALAPGEPAFAGGTGQGLAGMRERVRVFGGTLAAGPDEGESSCAPSCRSRRSARDLRARGRRPGACAHRPLHPRALRARGPR